MVRRFLFQDDKCHFFTLDGGINPNFTSQSGKMNGNMEELSRITAEQHQEFMATLAVLSDHELAYRLQLQEAMTASVAMQPPQHTPTISINHSGLNLQTLDLQKLETQFKDHLIIQTPTHRPFEDDNNDNNNNIHKNTNNSYDNDDDNNNNIEVFRVYFKGLLSEERVYGSGSSETVAGIGVAIFDSTDEIVYELKKPLKLIEGDRICRQRVEGQALIEALKAAAALDLESIVVFCDYYPLYQFVSGRWQPKQQKTIDILHHVNLLQESFTYHYLSLIACKRNFAFKFAREAIISQISKVVSTQEKLESCVICLDDKTVDHFFSINGCTHRYCYSCVKQHVEVKLLSGVLPKCPHEGCRSELRIESCEKFLTPKFTEMMRQRLKEDSIPVTEKVYCPYPKCSTLMSKTEALRRPRLVYGFGARTCYKCHGNLCINCRVPWHENMSCEEYKRRNPTSVADESKLKNLAARNLWRQCIKCKHMIELVAGCYHMTCRCGYEFCYTCGAEWKNMKATCNCPLWDEENIIDTEEEYYENDEFNDFEDEDAYDDFEA